MSELKARHIVDVYDSYYAENPFGELSQVYLKSEADKVIAEKDEEIYNIKYSRDEWAKACNQKDKVIAELKSQKAQVEDDCAYWITMLRKCADDNAGMAKQRAEALKRECYHKYKRCLAMAKWCATEHDLYKLMPRFAKMAFYIKWQKRWLELAEKFKEAK